MPNMSRRKFLGGAIAAAGVGAGAMSASSIVADLARADAKPLRSLEQIEHVIFLMQENRSFDSYFGSMSGVRGFSDPNAFKLPNGRTVFHQPAKNAVGYQLPFHLDTLSEAGGCAFDLDHGWDTQHASWNKGAMDGFVNSRKATDGDYAPYAMGYYKRADIPFYYELADAFTVADGYHASVIGGTNPNRLYMWSGTIDPSGKHGGPATNNSADVPFTWQTYPQRLEAAGISWQVYQTSDNYTDNALAWFPVFANAPKDSALWKRGMAEQPLEAFADDVAGNRLPQVSWLVPPKWWSEHPPFPPALGMSTTAYYLNVLRNNPATWAKTAVFLVYDENDGYFDHVRPPTPPPGTPGEFIKGQPIGLGFRVPMIAISPWSQGGWVTSQTFDHTSLIQFMEKRFGVEEPNITQWRRKTCGDLVGCFDFASANTNFPILRKTMKDTVNQVNKCNSAPIVPVPIVQHMPEQDTMPFRRKRATQ